MLPLGLSETFNKSLLFMNSNWKKFCRVIQCSIYYFDQLLVSKLTFHKWDQMSALDFQDNESGLCRPPADIPTVNQQDWASLQMANLSTHSTKVPLDHNPGSKPSSSDQWPAVSLLLHCVSYCHLGGCLSIFHKTSKIIDDFFPDIITWAINWIILRTNLCLLIMRCSLSLV